MVGVFSCRGCGGNFCTSHTAEHREHLKKSMDDVVRQYDQLKHNLNGQNVDEYQKSLSEQINQWEEDSVGKIRQLAYKTRQELAATVEFRNKHLKDRLEQIKQLFDKAKQDGGYYENDLKEWSNRLQDLQRTYVDQRTLQIDDNAQSIPFIRRISLNDTARRAFPNDRQPADPDAGGPYPDNKQSPTPSNGPYLKQNGNYPVTPNSKTTPPANLKELSFDLNEYDDSCLLLLGVISASADEAARAQNKTFYGWNNRGLVYRGGGVGEQQHDYKSDYRPKDTCVLSIDCERSMVSLKNEQTNASYSLEIDPTRCPRPWQIYARLVDERQ